MACGCTDNKIVNKIYDVDNKILNIEDMKNMSIDDIVRLYQDGYKIETMQYGTYCTGSVTLDKQNTNGSRELSVQLYTAFAQKVKPTSKCLNNVVLRLAVDSIRYNDMFVEIRESDPSTGLPRGDPNSSSYQLGYYRIPESSLPRYPSFNDIPIPLNILLSDSHINNGIWIVVFMYLYDPTRIDAYPYGYIKEDVFGNSNEYFAAKSGLGPWEGSTSINLYFKTNKQTYTVPCPTPVTTLSCPTAPVTQGSTANITANITTAGTPGYVYKLYIDSILKDTYPTTGTTNDTSHQFSHVFSESIGSRAVRVDVTDSCLTGAKTATNNCTIQIQGTGGCPTPVISISCPTSPINQGVTGNITATITTAGTPGYVYKLYRDAGPTPISTYPTTGKTNETSHTFPHTFSEAVGPHTFRIEVTDNCSTPQTASKDCALYIQAQAPTAGAGGAMMVAAIAAIGIAYFMMRKPPEKLPIK